MSEYIEFHQRIGNRFIPIASYSRSSCIFQLFKAFAPYEKIRPLGEDQLDAFYSTLADQEARYEDAIRKEEMTLEFLRTCDAPLQERLAERDEVMVTIRELREEGLEEVAAARCFLNFLNELITQCEWVAQPDMIPDRYIYCGIEIGDPSVEDILDEKI